MLGRTSPVSYPKIRCAMNPFTETESQERCLGLEVIHKDTDFFINIYDFSICFTLKKYSTNSAKDRLNMTRMR